MYFRYLSLLAMCLVMPALHAAETITVKQVEQLLQETDRAAQTRDAAGIGRHLSSSFAKNIDVPDKNWLYRFTLGRDEYLERIAKAWETLDDYTYQRDDTTIAIGPGGLSAESRSTITEETTANGERTVSRVREYAKYALEDGRPVITAIESFDLVPDPRAAR
jgi:hypothetical protein